MKFFLTAIIAVFISVGSFVSYEVVQPEPSTPITPVAVENIVDSKLNQIQSQLVDLAVGAFNPAAGSTYRLQTSIGSTDTSIRLASFKEPNSGLVITMTSLNSDIGYGTLDPQSNTRKELISFTGITQNADGSAILTGVTRGLSFLSPFTASSTLRQSHPGQSIFILSDSPQLFNEYAQLRGNSWITGTWGFGALPTSSVACSGATQFCNKAYIDALSIQGAATSTETNIGIVELSTNTEIAAGTASSSATGPLVPPNKYFNATQTSCNSIACVPVAVAGKLSQLFLDLTQHFNFTSLFATSASTTNATTTRQWIAGGAPGLLKLNDNLQVVKASTSTDYQAQRYVLNTSTDVQKTLTGFATSTYQLTVPGGIATASSTIRASMYVSFQGNDAGVSGFTIYLRTSTGVTLCSTGHNAATNVDVDGAYECVVTFNNSLSSQISNGYGSTMYTGGSTGFVGFSSEQTSSVDFNSNVSLVVVVEGRNTGTEPQATNVTHATIVFEP